LLGGHPCFGFGGGELRPGRIQGGLSLLVALVGDPPILEQAGIAPFIGFCLNDYCTRCSNSIALRREREKKVGVVDPHQRLAGFDLLADIHEPFHDLAGDAKTEIALCPCSYDAREATRSPATASPAGRSAAPALDR
jgi:hypothetical protein